MAELALVRFVISLPSLSVPSPAFWKPAAFAFGAGAFGAATAKLTIRVALTHPEPPGR